MTGPTVDAAAVVFNFERARFTKSEWRPTKPVADDFAYYGDQWGGTDNDSVITKVEAKDAKTVVFTTKTPYGPFLATIAMSAFPIVSPKSIKDDKDGWLLVGSKGAAGTGPFIFKPGAWQKDQQITLERQPELLAEGQRRQGAPVPGQGRVPLHQGHRGAAGRAEGRLDRRDARLLPAGHPDDHGGFESRGDPAAAVQRRLPRGQSQHQAIR